MNASVIAALLRAVSVAAVNPLLGGAGTAIAAVLKLGASLVELGDEGTEKLKELTAEVEAMVAEGREPTEAEFEALKSRSDAAHAILQGGG